MFMFFSWALLVVSNIVFSYVYCIGSQLYRRCLSPVWNILLVLLNSFCYIAMSVKVC